MRNVGLSVLDLCSDGQTPPTDPSHQSSLTTGDRTKKLSSKARKKERKQRGRGQRSTVSDSAHSSEVEGGVGVNSGDVAMATQPAGDEEYGSDLEDITEQLLNHNGGATGETKAEDKESEIDPLEEEDDDWEFQHTSSKRMPSWQQSRKGGGEVCEEEEESDQEEYVRPERDQPDPEEEASVAARREEKEMADFRYVELRERDVRSCCCRRREKERERMREERKVMRTVEERKMARAVPIPNPYTQFEQLHVPTLHVETSTDQLFKMIKTVPSRQVHTHLRNVLNSAVKTATVILLDLSGRQVVVVLRWWHVNTLHTARPGGVWSPSPHSAHLSFQNLPLPPLLPNLMR